MNTDEFEKIARRDMRELLIANGEASIDRLPVLRTIFEAAAADFVKTVEELFGAPPSIIVDEIVAARVGDVHPEFAACDIVAIYHVSELDCSMLIGVDRGFIIAMIEVMFGSIGTSPSLHEDRRSTHIETCAAQSAIDLLKGAFKRSLAPIVDVSLQLEAFEDQFDLAFLGRRSGVSILCAYRVRAFGNDGLALVAIPRSALEPFRRLLSQSANAEASAQDQLWTKAMQERVVQTEVTVRASMEKRGLTLEDVARFTVGQVICLPFSPTSLIKLECEKKGLFWCALGQKDGYYSVRIEDFVDEREEFIQTILNK